MPRRFLYVVLILFAALTAAVKIRAVKDIVRSAWEGRAGLREPFELEDYSNQVTKVRPEAASAGLLERDRILEVAGKPYTGTKVLGRELQRLQLGRKLVLRVAPDEGIPPSKIVEIPLQADTAASWPVRVT